MTAVSVLLPVHNGARYLERAARSILAQTHRDLELIVLDDGSTDGSGQIAESLGDPRIRLIRSDRNRGLAASLNCGLEAARAAIVARQDADDVSHPRRLEAQLTFLDANPDVALVGTQAWLIDESGRCRGSLEHARDHQCLLWELTFDNAFVHTSVAFRRDVVVRAGGYDGAWAYNQDYDLWLRLSRTTRLANLPERLVASRFHDCSMTRRMQDEAAAANRILLARGLALVFGELSPETIDLVARAREGMDLDELREFVPILSEWTRAYRARIEARSQQDFRATLARQHLALAFTRRRRTMRRVLFALWAGRTEGRALATALLDRLLEQCRLKLGYDPLASFDVASR